MHFDVFADGMASHRAILGLSMASVSSLAAWKSRNWQQTEAKKDPKPPPAPRRRQEQLEKLRKGNLDVLVVGGGATGCGVALDAAARGLSVGLVEREDFASGTSSRSTKLIHGGVRYLEKAVFQLDYGQLKLVFEALHERLALMNNAPHLTNPVPIMTPCYKWWEIPYYWAGLKAYDLVAGREGLTMSRFVSANEARRMFPTLAVERSDGEKLKGTIVYYDGQMNDAKLCLAIALSAQEQGAAVANYTEVVGLTKDDKGMVKGALLQDKISGDVFETTAKVVINAAGPFVDGIRKLADESQESIVKPSGGVHIVLPDYYSPDAMGLIVPKTKDGRVVFMLPWLDHTLAGTTDSGTDLTMKPRATDEEIGFILDAIKDYLNVQVRRSDVLSSWSGIRPLATDPNAKDTASISRDHIIIKDPEGIITITGGKWTTYRRMAEETVDEAIQDGHLQPKGPCNTKQLPLSGADGYHPGLFTEIAQSYTVPHRPGAIDTRVAKHLAHNYGGQALVVTKLAEDMKLGKRLVRGHPIIEAEVIYAARYEFCETVEDFVSRRSRLIFLDTRACKEAVPRIAELLAQEHNWRSSRRKEEEKKAYHFIHTFEAKEY